MVLVSRVSERVLVLVDNLYISSDSIKPLLAIQNHELINQSINAMTKMCLLKEQMIVATFKNGEGDEEGWHIQTRPFPFWDCLVNFS